MPHTGIIHKVSAEKDLSRPFKDRHLSGRHEFSQRCAAAPVIFGQRFFIAQLQCRQVEILDLVLCQMFLTERYDPAKVVIVYIMPSDQVIVIADDPDLADHFDVNAEFLVKLAPDGGIKVLVFFNSADGRLTCGQPVSKPPSLLYYGRLRTTCSYAPLSRTSRRLRSTAI